MVEAEGVNPTIAQRRAVVDATLTAFAQHAGVRQWCLKYGNMMLRALVDNPSAQLYPLQLYVVVQALTSARDLVAALPTGGGKTIIPAVVAGLMRTVVVLACPMNRLIEQAELTGQKTLGTEAVLRIGNNVSSRDAVLTMVVQNVIGPL